MEPIWHALPEAARGDVLITKPQLRSHPLVIAADGRRYDQRTRKKIARVLIAGAIDLATPRRNGWGIALMEHGAGQTYSERRNVSYAGTPGRNRVGLFICPNGRVAQANEALYARRSVVTGSPRLDVLDAARRRQGRNGTLTLALSWHWPNDRTAVEGGWAFPEFQSALVDLRSTWPGTIIGTAHPRAHRHVETPYRQAGIEFVRDWAEVIERAYVLSFDNTSGGFEAAALGIPVVVLDSLKWREDVQHGMRFWEFADIGPRVKPDTDSRSLAIRWSSAATRAMEEPVYAHRARIMAQQLYPHRGEAAQRAASALCRWIGYRVAA